MSTIYEVTLHMDRDLADEYDAWLREHVAEMLSLPGFLSAEISAIANDEAASKVGRVVHYRLENRAALDTYFHDHAKRMRDEGLRRFGDRVAASRRILSS